MLKAILALTFLVCCPLYLSGQEYSKYTPQVFYEEFDRTRFESVPLQGGDLHVVLAIDTNADTPGLGITQDGIHLLELLEALFPRGLSGEHKLATVRTLTGADCNPRQIIEAIRELDTRERDTILFYYSGHGGTDKEEFLRTVKELAADGTAYDGDHGQFLSTSSGMLSRSCVKEAMRSCPAQFRILLTDCCANFSSPVEAEKALKAAGPVRSGAAPTKSRNAEIKQPKFTNPEAVCKQLFFDSVGWVSVNAAPPSQSAKGSRKGGWFTLNTLSAIEERERLQIGIDWTIAHVKSNNFSSSTPVPFPGGVVNGMEDPRFVYSQIYSQGLELKNILARPENAAGPMYLHPENTIVTIRKGFSFALNTETFFQDGRLIRAPEQIDIHRPYASFSVQETGDRTADNQTITFNSGNQFEFQSSGKPSPRAADERFDRPAHVTQLIYLEAAGKTPERKVQGSVFPWASISFYYPGSVKYEPTLDDFQQAMGGYLSIEFK